GLAGIQSGLLRLRTAAVGPPGKLVWGRRGVERPPTAMTSRRTTRCKRSRAFVAFRGLPADRRSHVDPPDDVIRGSGDARIGDAGPILISAGQVNVARSGERKLVLWGQLAQRPCRRSLL